MQTSTASVNALHCVHRGTYADHGAWKHSTETTATSRLAQHDLPIVLLASFLSMVTGGGERTAAATGTKFSTK